jgi:hypothetical protein
MAAFSVNFASSRKGKEACVFSGLRKLSRELCAPKTILKEIKTFL